MDPGRADFTVGAKDPAADERLSWPLPAPVRAGLAAGPAEGEEPPADAPRSAVSVLADRLAAALVHHEPGWRLPRHSALARRYSVSAAEIDAAVEELIGRHLVRRLADGQLYRASPADYLIGLEGVPGLRSNVDAMGGEFACRSRQVSWRQPPEDISWALRFSPAEPVCVIRFLWTAGGEPAAFCTSYVPGDIAGRPASIAGQPLPTSLSLLRLSDVISGSASAPAGQGRETGVLAGTPAALHVEMQAPPPSVARSLRLSAGQPAMMVTVRFDDLRLGRPVALTAAVLRADMFRLVLETSEPPLGGDHVASIAAACAEALEDGEG
jgi:DNA-binding GntR family transcriptional regulator